MSRIDEDRPFLPLGVAIVTVSDTRGAAEDKSGDALQARIEEAGHRVSGRTIVRDEREALRSAVGAYVADPDTDVVLTTGGTGFTGRDVSPDALEPMFEKRMDGFSNLFHAYSNGTIGSSTLQSRATAGVAGKTFVFVLPGSTGACRDAWDGVLRAQLDYRHRPCNFVEILPRLDEHLKRGKLRAQASD